MYLITNCIFIFKINFLFIHIAVIMIIYDFYAFANFLTIIQNEVILYEALFILLEINY